MAGKKSPVVRGARRLAFSLALFDVALGLCAQKRPDLLRTTFGLPEGADGFYYRWGAQILGYAGVQALAALVPTPATFTAVAALRAVEVPADLSARTIAVGRARRLHPLASAFNAAATVLFLGAAAALARDRRRDDAEG